jgi:hypothetical protein
MTAQKSEREEALEAAQRIVAVDEGEPGADDDVGYVDTVLVARALLSSSKAEGEMRAAALDALSGWRYIRMMHGDLPGVGWDRVENALTAALKEPK